MAKETFEEAAKKLDIRALLISSVITGLAFVVGLTWNDAIKETVALFAPRGDSLFFRYAAAIVVTIIAAVISWSLYRSQHVKTHDLERLVASGRAHSLAGYQKVMRGIDLLRLTEREKKKLRRVLIRG